MSFTSTHDLAFMVAPWRNAFNKGEWFLFQIGTCHGCWKPTETSYDILAVDNDKPGNGHFQDVLEWFENSCKRDKRDLRFLEVMNKRLLTHLITKRGFTADGENAIKKFS